MAGYKFQVNREITITELGKFDSNGNGKLDDLMPPQVGVWNAADELIASTTIDVTATLKHGTFFSPIAPTSLPPGDYVIGVQTFDGQEPFSQDVVLATSGAMDWIEGRRNSSNDFALPTTRLRVESYFGPNFLIDEPIALFGPGERSVFQRDASGFAKVPLFGVTSGEIDRVEARATVMPGFSGSDTDWQTIDTSGGLVAGEIVLPAGGWYRIETRAYRGGDVLTGDSLERIGAGEVFVTAGQSNSANHGNPPQQPRNELVSALTTTGTWQHADDPQPMATGTGGSPWPILGDLLVERLGVPIGFVSVGWGGTTVQQWLPGASGPAAEPLYNRLVDALQNLGPNGARAILWHQGESDALANTSTEIYAERLQTLIDVSRQDAGYDVAWSIALASFLPITSKASEARIVDGQLNVISEDPIVFQGPLTDDLVGPEWRWDDIHFNTAGLHAHAERWADVITMRIVPEPLSLDLGLVALLLAAVARHGRGSSREDSSDANTTRNKLRAVLAARRGAEKGDTPPLHRYEVVGKQKTATEVIVVCEYRHAK